MKKDLLVIGIWVGIVIIGIYIIYTLFYDKLIIWYFITR